MWTIRTIGSSLSMMDARVSRNARQQRTGRFSSNSNSWTMTTSQTKTIVASKNRWIRKKRIWWKKKARPRSGTSKKVIQKSMLKRLQQLWSTTWKWRKPSRSWLISKTQTVKKCMEVSIQTFRDQPKKVKSSQKDKTSRSTQVKLDRSALANLNQIKNSTNSTKGSWSGRRRSSLPITTEVHSTANVRRRSSMNWVSSWTRFHATSSGGESLAWPIKSFIRRSTSKNKTLRPWAAWKKSSSWCLIVDQATTTSLNKETKRKRISSRSTCRLRTRRLGTFEQNLSSNSCF